MKPPASEPSFKEQILRTLGSAMLWGTGLSMILFNVVFMIQETIVFLCFVGILALAFGWIYGAVWLATYPHDEATESLDGDDLDES